jgi:hypothetical protein
MWFSNIVERILFILGSFVVLVAFVVTNPLAIHTVPKATAPYKGAGGGGGEVDPPPPDPDPDPPAPGAGDKVVWAVGDNCDDDFTSQQTTNVEGCKHVGDMIKADNTTNRVLLLGDTQYDEGEAINFTNYYNVGMGKQQIFAGSTDSIWDRSIAVPGNHEYLTSGAAPYYAYFGTVRSGDPTKGYFMTDLGKWRVIALNSNCSEVGGCGATSAQGIWAISALQAATAAGDSTIAIFHHPPITDGAGYAPETTSGIQMWNTIYNYGVDIVATGHDHQYQRFGPLSLSRTPSAGGPQFWVSGAGGRGNNGFSTLSGTNRTLFRWGKRTTTAETGSLEKEPGALRFVLKDDGTYTFEFKTANAGTFVVRDSGSGTSR